METIFGSDAVRAASVLYEQGADGIQSWIKKVDDQGAASKMASKRLDNLKGDVEALGGALETALIGTGDGSQGMLRGLTQGLTDTVNAYNDLPQAGKNATAAIAGTVAVAGGGLWAFSKVVGGISSTRDAMSNLGITADATKGKLRSAAAFVGGPWGLAFAGATVLLGDYMAQQAKTEGYVDALTAALEDQSGAMTRQAIATNLNEEEWLAYAESIGLSADTVIDAALGSAEAMQAVRDAAGEHDGFWGGFGEAEDAKQFVANVEAQSRAQKQAEKEARLLAEANRETGSSAGAASGPVASLAESMTGAAQETESFKDMIDRLNGVLEGRSNMRSYEAAIDDFTKSLKENGRTFDINTEKGRNNQAALDNIASSALAVAENMGKAQRQKFLTSAIDDIRTMGKQMNLPKSEVRRLIELLQEANGTNVDPDVTADTSRAMGSLREVDTYLDSINGKRVTTYVDTVRSVTGTKGAAAFSQYAAGGYVVSRGPGRMPEALEDNTRDEAKEEVAA